jgi:hypothetical protein
MSKNIFDILFVLSLTAPATAVLVGAFALAIPLTRLRWGASEHGERGGHAFRGQGAR